MLDVWNRSEQPFGVTPKSNGVEKADGIDGDVDAGGRQLALLDQMVKPVGDLLVVDQLWRALVIARQFSARKAVIGRRYADCDFTIRACRSGTPRSGFVQQVLSEPHSSESTRLSPSQAA